MFVALEDVNNYPFHRLRTIMSKKLILFVLFVLVLTASLAAETFIIRSYDFDIIGKTRSWAAENIVSSEKDEKTYTRDGLVSFLEKKKQTLISKNAFESVEYTYTEETVGDTVYVDVTFHIEDKGTISVLPYPEYDSNYGLRLNIKYSDRNTLGTFSNFSGTMYATVEPWDFDTTEYYASFKLSNLKIGETVISSELTGNASQTDGLYNYNTSLSVRDIKIGSRYYLDLGFGLKNTGKDMLYSASTSFSGLSIGSVGFNPSVSMAFYEKTTSSSYITPSLSTYGIRIGVVRLSFYDYLRFSGSSFRLSSVYHSTSLSFAEGSLAPVSYYQSVSWSPKYSFSVYNTVNWNITELMTLYFHEDLSWTGEDFTFSSSDTGIGISREFNIGEHFSIEPELTQYLTVKKDSDGEISLHPYYSFSASANGNYIKHSGNFRDGVSYSFSISESWYEEYPRTAKGTYIDKAEVQVHKLFGSWFNPSVRILGVYTNSASSYGSPSGSGTGYFGEYLRGVRNKTVKNDGRNRNNLSLVVNLNLMAELPLPSFMSSSIDIYLNLFCDYAFTKHDTDDSKENGIRNYLGFGIETIGILKKYPEYPIRASVGFDGRKLYDYANGDSESRDFYEIYVGLDLFF